ncbi:MAG: class I SAM-dependent methyltransferase [Solirubrobacteraceae bacterium]
MTTDRYVHGYRPRESERLHDQARTLAQLLHGDTRYPPESTVLEAGCGVGAQTVTLAQNSPGARVTSVDISAESLGEARRRVGHAGLGNVTFRQGDLFELPFDPASFDHVFVCFVLEHLEDPVGALEALGRMLRPGGSITVIEGDHGSTSFHPESPAARAAIACQIELQARAGGNALVGRQVYPLLAAAGFDQPQISPRMVYVDASRPELVDGFIRKTFTAMVQGVRDPAIAAGLIDPASFDAGIAALHRTTQPDGVFSYTFFKGVAHKARASDG